MIVRVLASRAVSPATAATPRTAAARMLMIIIVINSSTSVTPERSEEVRGRRPEVKERAQPSLGCWLSTLDSCRLTISRLRRLERPFGKVG